MTEQATRTCQRCHQTKGLIEFKARRKTCAACETATAAKRLERKEAVVYSPELAERITDMLAAGMSIAEVCTQSVMPTPRQLRAMRRANPDFDAACDQAEAQSAGAHLDKAKEVLRSVEAGTLPAADGRLLFDGHLKLATTLNPKRYGGQGTVDITSAGRPLIDLGSAIKALLDATANATALPAPEPLDVEAEPAPRGTLQ